MSSAAATAADVVRFREILTGHFGWSFEGSDPDVLAPVLFQRAAQGAMSVRDYLRGLAVDDSKQEFAALAEKLTVTETSFFRQPEHFQAVADVVLPNRMRARGTQRRLRALSVGCASGEEPYTLAIVALESITDPSWNVSVVGLDVNPAMLRKAAAGRYTAWSLRDTPAAVRQRWFHTEVNAFDLDPRVRALVRFVSYNAADDDRRLWPTEEYDVVFCRNLLMYLTREAAAALIERITRSLAPEGYLFLGHTDFLSAGSPGLRTCFTHGTSYYQRTTDPRPAPLGLSTSHRPAAPALSADRDLATRLLRQERFTEAIAVVERLSPRDADARDVRLLHAVLLMHTGSFHAARQVCQQLLAREGPDADAYHLLAMCHESDGDAALAAQHHRVAVHIDERFAMPRLRLGLLARRHGDRATAAIELTQAVALLAREEEQRLLYFGGGFDRRALITLCRAELDACERVP